VSDGSFWDRVGAAARIIEGHTLWTQVTGTIITPGGPDNHSSFWSKLAGIYGVLLTLKALVPGEKGLSCCLACDGKSMLDCIKLEHPVLPIEPHTDMLNAVKTKVQQIGIQIHWNHIKGHQDGKLTTALPQDAWLNVKANLLAKAKVDPAYCRPAKYQLPGEGWICYIGSQHIVKQLSATLCAHVNEQPAKKYWKTKFWLSDSLWQSIHWRGLGQAYTKSSMTTQRWVVKHTLGFFAHGKNILVCLMVPMMWNWGGRQGPYYAMPKCGGSPNLEPKLKDITTVVLR